MIDGSYFDVQANAVGELRALLPDENTDGAVFYVNTLSAARCTFVLVVPDRVPLDITLLVARILLLPMQNTEILAIKPFDCAHWDDAFDLMAPECNKSSSDGRVDIMNMAHWLETAVHSLFELLGCDTRNNICVYYVTKWLQEEPPPVEEQLGQAERPTKRPGQAYQSPTSMWLHLRATDLVPEPNDD